MTKNHGSHEITSGHGPKGSSERERDTPHGTHGQWVDKVAGKTVPRDRFRESADRVLTEHKRALDWLRDK